MNDELQKQLAALLDSAHKTGADLAAFVQAQAPELAEQLLRWHFWKHASISVFSFVVMVAAFYLARRWAKDAKMTADEYAPAFCVGLAAMAVLVFNLYWTLKVYVAPKIVLIEAIQDLMK